MTDLQEVGPRLSEINVDQLFNQLPLARVAGEDRLAIKLRRDLGIDKETGLSCRYLSFIVSSIDRTLAAFESAYKLDPTDKKSRIALQTIARQNFRQLSSFSDYLTNYRIENSTSRLHFQGAITFFKCLKLHTKEKLGKAEESLIDVICNAKINGEINKNLLIALRNIYNEFLPVELRKDLPKLTKLPETLVLYPNYDFKRLASSKSFQKMQTEETRLAVLRRIADIAEYFGDDFYKDRESLDPITAARESYDPNCKNIGFISDLCISDIVLVAGCNSILRATHPNLPNFLFIPPLTSNEVHIGIDSNRNKNIYVKSGFIIDRQFAAVAVRFNPPLRLDALDIDDRLDTSLIKRLLDDKINLLNGTPLIEIASDKQLTKKFLDKIGVQSPKQILITNDSNLKTILRQIKDWKSSELVIKPTSACQGIGVSIVPTNDRIKIKTTVKNLLMSFGKCVIEERVQTVPLYDKQGNKLDWNIRILNNRSGIIDMEARVGRWGRAINKSKGAKILEVNTVFRRLQKSYPDAPSWGDFCKKLQDLTKKIGSHSNASFMSLDLIVDRNWNLSVIEINGSMSGGIGSLTKLRNGKRKLASGKNFALALAKDINMQDNTPHTEFSSNPLFSDYKNVLYGRFLNEAALYLSRKFSGEKKSAALLSLNRELDKCANIVSKEQKELIKTSVAMNILRNNPSEMVLHVLSEYLSTGGTKAETAGVLIDAFLGLNRSDIAYGYMKKAVHLSGSYNLDELENAFLAAESANDLDFRDEVFQILVGYFGEKEAKHIVNLARLKRG